MNYVDAPQKLKQMLGEAGADPASPEPGLTWDVFTRFAQMAVDGVASADGDMCLFQWGTHDWHDGRGELFEIDFLRQFMIEEDGEYDHMEQLHCTFRFSPTEELRSLGAGDLWASDDLSRWFAEVEAMPVFAVLRHPSLPPAAVRIEQEVV